MDYTCLQCNQTFQCAPSKKRKFCSKTCFDLYQKKGETLVCQTCDREFYARPIYIQRGGKFCSRKCRAKGQEKKFLKRCLVCRAFFETTPSRDSKGEGKYCTKRCSGIATGWRQSKTKYGNGKFLTIDKYWATRRKKKIVKEHRCIVEDFLERKLTENEVVHYCNGIKLDNRIENLYLFNSPNDHSRYHADKKKGEVEKILKSNLETLKNEDLQKGQDSSTT